MINVLQLSPGGCKMAYVKYGIGNKALVAFHGFGQDKSVYKPFAEHLHQYTVYSFDLFFHGDSHYVEKDKALDPQVFITLFSSFLEREFIQKFSIIGFSIGAKFALLLTQYFAKDINHLILVGPDGVVPNFWYQLATGNGLSRRFYKTVVFNPNLFFMLLFLANSFKLANPTVIKFAKNQMDTQVKRSQVYDTWMVFRKINTPFKKLTHAQQIGDFKIVVFLGNQDLVIPLRELTKKLVKLNNLSIFELESRHSTLLIEASNFIKINKLLY